MGAWNSGGRDTFTRNLTDGRTMRRVWFEINIPFFLKKKAGIISACFIFCTR